MRNDTEKDDGSCCLIHSPSWTHTVSLKPQQSVLCHKEDYTSGTRGFPGIAHSNPVCWLSVSCSVIAMVTLHLLDILHSKHQLESFTSRSNSGQIWDFILKGNISQLRRPRAHFVCLLFDTWSSVGLQNQSWDPSLVLSLFLVRFFSVFLACY